MKAAFQAAFTFLKPRRSSGSKTITINRIDRYFDLNKKRLFELEPDPAVAFICHISIDFVSILRYILICGW